MVSRLAFGRAPIFEFGTVQVLPLQYIWIAVVVGIAAGLAGIVFNKGLLNIPALLQPALLSRVWKVCLCPSRRPAYW